jgi:uncharacterized protein YndB with AHSA1/START domain
VAGRLVREVGALARRAVPSGKRLPTLTIDTQIGFRSAADRAAFADDLTAAVLDLAARYHHDDGRPHRLSRVEHRMERSYVVAATPEQVWDAIATAAGISAWMVPTTLDPQVGGEVSFDLGGFTSTGVVTGYEAHHRFAYEEPWPIAEREEDIPAEMTEWFDSLGVSLSDMRRDLTNATPIATEFLIASASGGSCVIRVVSSAYGSGADWEHEFFAEMVTGWAELLAKLVTHLGGGAS